jgi:hypothetical protein
MDTVERNKMNLTGKCKQDFEAWFSKEFYASASPNKVAMSVNEFYNLPLSMQFGVIQEWADSVGIDVIVYRAVYSIGFHYMITAKIRCNKSDASLPIRESAQLAAIEKLNEIYNGL